MMQQSLDRREHRPFEDQDIQIGPAFCGTQVTMAREGELFQLHEDMYSGAVRLYMYSPWWEDTMIHRGRVGRGATGADFETLRGAAREAMEREPAFRAELEKHPGLLVVLGA